MYFVRSKEPCIPPSDLKLLVVLFIKVPEEISYPLLSPKESKADHVHCTKSELRTRGDMLFLGATQTTCP